MKKETYIDQVIQPKGNYYPACFQFAKVFIQSNETFTSEDIIEAYIAQNKHKLPAEPRVWGAVLRELRKMDLIECIGFGTYRKKCGHGKPVRIWKSKVNINN